MHMSGLENTGYVCVCACAREMACTACIGREKRELKVEQKGLALSGYST